MVSAFREALVQRTQQPDCRVGYVNSAGATVTLSFDQLVDRVYAMSFDPYHCPELRWGAPDGSPELATCPDDARKRGWYRAEQRLRQRIDRAYGVPTPLASGPERAEDIDVRRVLGISR